MQAFRSKDPLGRHQEWCLSNNGIAMMFPKPENIIKFNSNHYYRKIRISFVICAAFECFIKPIDYSCEPNPQESDTQAYQQNEPSSAI